MDKFIAIFAVALGAVYSDFSADDIIGSFLFPSLFVAGIAYLFWFKGLVAITLGCVSAYYSDVTSTSIMQSILLPLFIVICLFYLLFWLYVVGLFDHDGCGGGDDGDFGCDGGGSGGRAD